MRTYWLIGKSQGSPYIPEKLQKAAQLTLNTTNLPLTPLSKPVGIIAPTTTAITNSLCVITETKRVPSPTLPHQCNSTSSKSPLLSCRDVNANKKESENGISMSHHHIIRMNQADEARNLLKNGSEQNKHQKRPANFSNKEAKNLSLFQECRKHFYNRRAPRPAENHTANTVPLQN